MEAATNYYASWIRRAETFVRGLRHLPGRWGISVAIDPPLSDSEADDLARVLPFGLPTSLRELYTKGAAKCQCRYHWSPDGEHLREVHAVFPHQMSFYGGAEFIPWDELLNAHEIHSWWDDEDDNLTQEQLAAREIWRQTIPFINVGNGDCVALHITDDTAQMPVVYLCHDDPENRVTRLSPSLDRFLADWESLCYVGPEIWLLSTFLAEDGGGLLDVEKEEALEWRRLLLQQGDH